MYFMSLKLSTFSVVARDPSQNTLGIAVSTKVPAVGSLCPFIRYGVGAVCTQAWVNPELGPLILDRLSAGERAEDALHKVITNEADSELRQVGVVDFFGGSAAFTGSDTDHWTGHLTGRNYSIQGNMLVDENTLIEMENTITANKTLDLSERLLATLEAGQSAGGDRRGRQSAALLVHNQETIPLVDLRVDENADPVKELRRIYEIAKKELFPFIEALPTPRRPKGNFSKIRDAIAPKH